MRPFMKVDALNISPIPLMVEFKHFFTIPMESGLLQRNKPTVSRLLSPIPTHTLPIFLATQLYSLFNLTRWSLFPQFKIVSLWKSTNTSWRRDLKRQIVHNWIKGSRRIVPLARRRILTIGKRYSHNVIQVNTRDYTLKKRNMIEFSCSGSRDMCAKNPTWTYWSLVMDV